MLIFSHAGLQGSPSGWSDATSMTYLQQNVWISSVSYNWVPLFCELHFLWRLIESTFVRAVLSPEASSRTGDRRDMGRMHHVNDRRK